MLVAPAELQNIPCTKTCLVYCLNRRDLCCSPYAQVKTLYSRFPQDRCRLVALHLVATLVIYLIIYPFVNLVWSFSVNIDDEVA